MLSIATGTRFESSVGDAQAFEFIDVDPRAVIYRRTESSDRTHETDEEGSNSESLANAALVASPFGIVAIYCRNFGRHRCRWRSAELNEFRRRRSDRSQRHQIRHRL